MKIHFLLCGALWLSSCMAGRMQLQEQALFPEADGNTWWLISIVPNDLHSPHYGCALLTMHAEKGQAVYSQTISCLRGGAFANTANTSIIMPTEPAIGAFPLRLPYATSDSLETDNTWKFTRKGFALRAATLNDNLPLILEAQWPVMPSFSPEKVCERPQVWALPPISTRVHVRNGSAGAIWNGQVQIQTFHNAQELLQAKGAVVWLALYFADGSSVSLLGECQMPATVTPFYAIQWQPGEQMHPFTPAYWQVLSDWDSPHSLKRYPLHFFLQLHPDRSPLLVRPVYEMQEAGNGHKALWMGAVAVYDPATGTQLGAGNACIFTH